MCASVFNLNGLADVVNVIYIYVKIKSADGTTEKTFVRKPVSAPIQGNEGTVESMLEGTNYNAIFGAQQQPAGGAGEAAGTSGFNAGNY
jgi:hypothetical protein